MTMNGPGNEYTPGDDEETRQEVVPTGQPSRPATGFRQGQAVPSIHDVFMTDQSAGQGGSSFNLVEAFLKGSYDPAEYLPRGCYERPEIARRKRMVLNHSRIYNLNCFALNDALWVGDQMMIGLHAAGRQDAKEVAKAQFSMERERVRQGMGVMGFGRPQPTAY